MGELVDFIKENIISISIIVIVVLLLLVIIKIRDINFEKPESTLKQQVTVETLDTLDNTFTANTIDSYYYLDKAS